MHSIYKGYINRITSLTACQHLDIKRPLVCLLSSSHGDYEDSCVTHVENALSDIIAHDGVTLIESREWRQECEQKETWRQLSPYFCISWEDRLCVVSKTISFDFLDLE